MIDRAALIASLLADPSNAAGVSRDDAAALLTALATLQVVLLQVACRSTGAQQGTPSATTEDQLVDVDAAAAALGVTPRWLYRHAPTLPFTRQISRKVVRFSRAGIQRWLATTRPLKPSGT